MQSTKALQEHDVLGSVHVDDFPAYVINAVVRSNTAFPYPRIAFPAALRATDLVVDQRRTVEPTKHFLCYSFNEKSSFSEDQILVLWELVQQLFQTLTSQDK